MKRSADRSRIFRLHKLTVCTYRHRHSRPDSYHKWSSRRATGAFCLPSTLNVNTAECHTDNLGVPSIVCRNLQLLLLPTQISRYLWVATLCTARTPTVSCTIFVLCNALILTAALLVFRHLRLALLPLNLAKAQRYHITLPKVRLGKCSLQAQAVLCAAGQLHQVEFHR